MTPTSLSPAEVAPSYSFGVLLNSFIAELSYKVTLSEGQQASGTLDMEVGMAVARRAGMQRQINLKVAFKSGGEAKTPYEVRAVAIVILGGFSESQAASDIDVHAAKVGAPIAYSVIREELLQLSARGPASRLMLGLIPLPALINGMAIFDEAGVLLTPDVKLEGQA